MPVITSRNNPVVKRILSLREKKYRLLYGEYLVEGEKMTSECISAGQTVKSLILSESACEGFKAKYEGTMPVTTVSEDVFKKLSDEKSPQGVLAVVALPERQVAPPEKSCILLDGVADPGNLGTIIRTANAAGYEEIYLLSCADPYAPKAVRASMSGIFHTDLYISSSAEEILDALQGVPLVTADLCGENIFNFLPPEKFCLVIGNEGHGVSEEVNARKSYTVTIPMRESQESLNAGVSAGIAMYLLKRKQFGA